jgi:hypothetical protein
MFVLLVVIVVEVTTVSPFDAEPVAEAVIVITAPTAAAV